MHLLYTYQSDFRKNHSTDFCLSYLNGKGIMTGMILIDLQKVFDTKVFVSCGVPQVCILGHSCF